MWFVEKLGSQQGAAPDQASGSVAKAPASGAARDVRPAAAARQPQAAKAPPAPAPEDPKKKKKGWF